MKLHNSIPITLPENLLTFRDTGKTFKLKGNLSKMITNKKYHVYDFTKEMHLDVRILGNRSTQDRSLMKLLKSRSSVVSGSGVSKTKFSPSDPDEFCD